MVHRLPFITGVVMLVIAGTLAFVVTNGDESRHAETPVADRGKGAKEQFQGAGASGAWQQESQAGDFRPEISSKPGRPSRSRAGVAGSPERAQATLRTNLKVRVKPGHPRHEELEASANRIESFALRRLAQLTNDLELTADQQTRIFPILVRGTQSYDPGMQIVDGRGSNGSSKPVSEDTAADTKPLDPQQQQELLQEELDLPQAEALVNLSERDLMIWEELINDLTKQLDQATPGQVAAVTPTTPTQTPTSAPTTEPEPEREVTGGAGPSTPAAETPATGSETTTPPESHGGRNLFDLVPGG